MSSEQSLPAPAAGKSRGRWLVVIGGTVLTLLLAGLAGREFLIRQRLQAAEAYLNVGAIGPAQQLLGQVERLSADDPRVDLLQAACNRQLGDIAQEQRALASAWQNDAAEASLALAKDLSATYWGRKGDISSDDVARLESLGGSPQQAITAVIKGMLAQQRTADALQLLEESRARPMNEATLRYLRGLCLQTASDRELARAEFERTLEIEPGHEPARLSLGRLLEQQEAPSKALPHYKHLTSVAPQRDGVRIDLSRVLRKLGRGDEARAVLPEPAADDVTQAMAIELAERAYETGDYPAALKWYRLVDLDGPLPAETLRTAASVLALGGAGKQATQIFTRVDNAQRDFRHGGELQRRLAIDPQDDIAAGELRHMQRQQASESMATPTAIGLQNGGAALYHQHCAACHGDNGDGSGRAARFLTPRPTSLRRGRFTLISTRNGVPTREDLQRAITSGVPGTSMPPFPQLTANELNLLVDHVQELQRSGVAERLRLEDDEITDTDVDRIATDLTTPREVLSVPSVSSGTDALASVGREVYLRSGCQSCHGDDGQGSPVLPLFDDDGRVSTPRNLVLDPMKGGDDVEPLYRRIRLGMPGTPHPANPTMSDADALALVAYCRSLGRTPKWLLTNYQRRRRAVAENVDSPGSDDSGED